MRSHLILSKKNGLEYFFSTVPKLLYVYTGILLRFLPWHIWTYRRLQVRDIYSSSNLFNFRRVCAPWEWRVLWQSQSCQAGIIGSYHLMKSCTLQLERYWRTGITYKFNAVNWTWYIYIFIQWVLYFSVVHFLCRIYWPARLFHSFLAEPIWNLGKPRYPG